MKRSLKIQMLLLLALILFGLLCGYIQGAYYGYVDENGIVHDSLFLPLSVLSLLAAGVLATLFMAQISFYALFKKRKNS